MEAILKITCLNLLVFGLVQGSVLPVEKCTLTDSACMIPAIQKMLPIFAAGMPEYDVEVLDPISDLNMKFELSGLDFSLSGASLKGFKTAVIKDFDWNTEKQVFSVGFATDLSLKGNYKAGGRVLILPITGDGQTTMKMKNAYVKVFIYYKMENGHVKPTKYDFEFDIKDNTHFYLSNLFNGNKQLSDAMLLFLNQNWKPISTEFGKPLVDAATNRIYKNIRSFFKKLPIADIANV